ncbi:hypothetical protein MD484_g7659, partial [Candolleomyces efflorescens]
MTAAVQTVDDSAHDRIIAELRTSLAAAAEALSQSRHELSVSRAETVAKDLHLASLVESRRELQTLCSAMQVKTTNDEATIVKLTRRSANSEAESVSREGQIVSLTKEKGEWSAKATSTQEMITLQEAVLLELSNILRAQDKHNDTLSRTVKRLKQSRSEKDSTITQLNDKLTEHARENGAMRDHISSLVKECETLEGLRQSTIAAAAQSEETIARLKLNLAEKTTAAGEWKDLYIQSLSQPHQPRMHARVPSSTLGIIAEKDRKIAELNDKLSECYGYLVASQAGNLGGGLSLPPIIVVGDGFDVGVVEDSNKNPTVWADIARLLVEFLGAAIALLVKELHGRNTGAKPNAIKVQRAPARSDSDLTEINGNGKEIGCTRQADGAPIPQQIRIIAGAKEMTDLKEQLATALEELRIERLEHATTRAENLVLMKNLQSKREEALVALAEALVALSETRCAQDTPTGESGQGRGNHNGTAEQDSRVGSAEHY